LHKAYLRKLALWIIPPIGMILIRLIALTNRKIFHLPRTIPQEPVIVAFWHGNLIMQMYAYSHYRQTPKINVLISDHFDGEIIARIGRYFQLGTIRGSSRRGAAKALMQGLKSLSNGYDIGITPDGPKGPRYEVSDGVVVMAQKRKTKVVAFHCVPTAYWQFRSWDRFVVPKPFGQLDFYVSEPIDVEGMEMEQAKAIIKEHLMKHAL
jgi:lysophospholipid acyltransferase (LPLAT)-like uncharacterized protein